MIELTVKTLDSQNHKFTVEDDITVEQFKVKIADTVNIPAETQRIIYCGRVLQDTSKLADYDLNGKVVHLVQRAPPGTTPRPSSRSASPQTQRRTFRGFRGADQGNSMYLASMAFPGNLMESQGIVPPPPTHNLSGSRLVVASRMLRRAEAIISLLENPNARTQEQNTGEENQEEEVTTVIEARVLVPNVEDQPMNDVISVVQNSLLDAARNTETEMNVDPINVEVRSLSGTSTPAASATPRRAASAENLNTEARAENTGNGLPENASPTSEMAELLTTLGQLQSRFAPFLDRYHRFMQEDPEVPAEDQRQTQTMLNRVSEVMHFLGHAYHSLSDIIVRVRAPPPRPLLCRPILIQHSAVLQTGIPIQVEINLPTDRQPPPPNSNEASATTNSTTSSTTTTSSAASTSEVPLAPNTTAAASTTATQSGGQSIPVPPAFVGLPFLPGAVRVQSFPIEIRSVRSSSAPPRPQNNNNNTVPTTAAATGTVPPATGGAANATGGASNATSTPNGPTVNPEGGPNANSAFNFNNPNVEFFMEVTPEVLRGALNGPPPEFLQSLMQMAGQIMSRNLNTTAPPPASSSASTTTTAESTATTGAQAAATNAGQNSQARGNTQTNPTTATHTRSTPRPHVHLAQQAMQGGFDPFLPCNSHHISRRNRMQATQFDISERVPQAFTWRTNASRNEQRSTAQNSSSNSRSTSSSQSNTTQPNNPPDLANIINNIFDTVRAEARPSDPDRNRRFGDGMLEDTNMPFLGALFSGISGRNMFRESRENLTLDQLFREGQEAEAGESILGDLQILLFRNLSFMDMVSLSSGSSAPIHRFLPDIRNFILTRVCDGDTTQNGIDRGVENLLNEIRPSLQTFGSAPCYDDTDIVRSIEELLRQRLPNIINIGLNLNNYSVSQLIVQCVTTLKQILALFLYVVRSQGHGGSEQMIDYLLNRLPIEASENPAAVFPISLIRIQFREYLRNLNVSNSVLQPYLVRSQDTGRSSNVENGRTEGPSGTDPGDCSQTENVDTMEIDDAVVAGSSNLASRGLNNAEPLSNILIGSERWRGQVTEGWLPVMRQRRQNPPTTFSDTYLASMPSKRRKLVNNSKPQDSLPQVISDTVRDAVTATGLEGIAPLDTVADEAGASSEIQAAYRSLLRTTVQASLEDNEDFVPERFPNVANYFNKDLQ